MPLWHCLHFSMKRLCSSGPATSQTMLAAASYLKQHIGTFSDSRYAEWITASSARMFFAAASLGSVPMVSSSTKTWSKRFLTLVNPSFPSVIDRPL